MRGCDMHALRTLFLSRETDAQPAGRPSVAATVAYPVQLATATELLFCDAPFAEEECLAIDFANGLCNP